MINTENIKQTFDQYLSNPTDSNRNEVIVSSFPVVEQVVSKFQNGKIIERDDLFQEGILGVCSAIDKFSSGEEFESKIFAQIKSFVLRYSLQQDPLTTNQYSKQKFCKINKFSEQFIEQNGREPNNEEISKALGIKAKNLNQFKNLSSAVTELDDLIPSETNIDQEISRKDDIIHLLRVIENKLTDNEKNIISKKYGLNCEKMTLEQIGISMQPKLCKQRVDQIHKNILNKLSKFIN